MVNEVILVVVSGALDPSWTIHNRRFQETTHLLRREWACGVIKRVCDWNFQNRVCHFWI